MFVQVFSDKTVAMRTSSGLLVHLIHIVLLNSSALYQRCLVQDGLTLMRLMPVKMEKCKESQLHGEGRGECANYWFTGMEVVQEEEGIMQLG